ARLHASSSAAAIQLTRLFMLIQPCPSRTPRHSPQRSSLARASETQRSKRVKSSFPGFLCALSASVVRQWNSLGTDDLIPGSTLLRRILPGPPALRRRPAEGLSP